MFVSAFSGLPPMLWSSEQLAANLYNGSGLDPAALLSTMTAAAAGAGAGAGSGMDPEKRPQGLPIPSSTAASFFISDILYPSVIPLPGTLPHTSPGGHSTTAATTSPPPPPPLSSSTTSPSPDPPSPIVPPRASVIVLQPRSRDLKFGIDRILSATTTTKGSGGTGVGAGASRLSPQMSPAEADVARKKEKHATDSRSAGAQVSSSDSSPASVLHRSPPTTMPPCTLPPATTCPCSSPTCTTPLRHPHHPHHHPPPHHLSFHPLAGFGGTDGRGGMGQGQGGLRLPPPHPHAPHPHHPPPGVPHHPALYPHPPPPHHHHHQRDLFHRTPTYPGPYGVLGGSSDVTSNGGTQSPAKRKRSWSRAVFSNLQRKGLEKRFEVQKYVTKPDRRQLAAMLGLTDAQVKVWFQNRRMKWRHAEEQKKKRTAGDGDDETTADGKNKSPGEENNKSPVDEETGGEVEVSEVLSLHAKDDDDDEDLDGEMSLEIDVESCQESDDEETEMTLTLHEKLTS